MLKKTQFSSQNNWQVQLAYSSSWEVLEMKKIVKFGSTVGDMAALYIMTLKM